MAARVLTVAHLVSITPSVSSSSNSSSNNRRREFESERQCSSQFPTFQQTATLFLTFKSKSKPKHRFCVVSCLPPPPPPPNTAFNASTKLYVSGLSFRTTEESLRNAFQKFGQLVEVNLVMDRIANRPRGFAFLRYATEEESKKAIEGMHGKFLDGRVIFVEVAKPRSETRRSQPQNPRQY